MGAAQSVYTDGVVGEASTKKAPRNIQACNRRCAPRQRPPSGRERQALQVIGEEDGYQLTRRRRQLIPRARLVHRGRAEEPSRRSPSLQFRLIARARPLLLTPPPDFRSDDRTAVHDVGAGVTRRRALPGYVTGNDKTSHDTIKAEHTDTQRAATLTKGTSTARRRGSYHKNISSGSVDDCRSNTANTAHRAVAHTSAFSTPDGPSANGALNSHKVVAESTEQTIQTFVQETKDGFPDIGKEIAQLVRLCADVQARSCGSANTPKNTTEEDSERTTYFISNSIRRGHSEPANKLKLPKADLPTYNAACTCDSADTADGTNNRIKEHPLQSVALFHRHSRDSARTRPHFEGQSEKKNKNSTGDNETRQNNVYGHLSDKDRAVQDSAGTTAKTAPHSSGKRFNKAQRVDADKDRRTENAAIIPSNQTEVTTCQKEREIDSDNEIQIAASEKNHTDDNEDVIHSKGCGPKINHYTIKENGTGVHEYSGNRCNTAYNATDVTDEKDKYSAGEKRKRARSAGDKTKQAEISARDRKGAQHSLGGKVKKTDGILSEKSKNKGVAENQNRNKNSAEGKDGTTQNSAAQEVGSSGTVRQPDTGATDSCVKDSGPAGEHDTMSRRPQVLKIKDSAKTAPRHDDIRPVSCGERTEACRPERPSAAGEEQADSEGHSVTTTRTLRSFFEGGTEKTSFRTDKPKQNKVTGRAVTAGGTREEDADKASPMSIATLSVEDSRNESPKLENRTKTNSSPDHNTDPPTTLPSGKTPASTVSTCRGQGTLTSVTKSVPSDLELSKHNSSDRSFHTDQDSKVAAFDGLLQYLQDYKYGLREMLVNNNVVIIEPVRQSSTKLEDWKSSSRKAATESTCRITGATVKKSGSTLLSHTLPRQQKSQQPILRRHFFYHPIRTNRSLVDEELPDPDKVRHAREMFERTMKIKDPCNEEVGNANETVNNKNNRNSAPKTNGVSKAENINSNKVKRKYLTVDTVFRHNVWHKRWTDSGSLSSGVSSDLSCYETDVDSHDTFTRKEEPTDIFSSDDNDYPDKSCYPDENDEGHYVAPEVLERIRACGTTVTYYGGQVIAASNGPVRSPMTLAIMDEIQRSKNNCKQGNRIIQDEYLGVKFRLVKSNSCGSRLELAGTEGTEKWNCRDKQNYSEKQNSWQKDTPNAEKCRQQLNVSETTQNAGKSKEYTQSGTARSSTTGSPDSLSPRLNEGRPMFGEREHTRSTYIRGGPPHHVTFLDRGNSKLPFDDMEFEEYEVADDSLNVMEDINTGCSKTTEENGGEKHHRDGQPAADDINITSAAAAEQSQDLGNSASKENNDVQMITWASRSVQFD